MISRHFAKIESHIQRRSRIRTKDLFKMMDQDSLLVIIAILSVLNIILAPLPVNSFILGIPLIIFSACYILEIDIAQKNYKWLRRPIKCARWRYYMPKSKPIFVHLDKFTKPRLRQFTSAKFRVLSGLSLFFLAIVIFLPIPFANTPGSIGMLLLTVGMLQKDGLFVLIGHGVTALHIVGIIFLTTFMGYSSTLL